METKAWIVRIGEDYNRAADNAVSTDCLTRMSGENYLVIAKQEMRRAQEQIAYLNNCLMLEAS